MPGGFPGILLTNLVQTITNYETEEGKPDLKEVQCKGEGHDDHTQTGTGVQHPGGPFPASAALFSSGGQKGELGLLHRSRRSGAFQFGGQAPLLGQGELTAELRQIHQIALMANEIGSGVVDRFHARSLRFVLTKFYGKDSPKKRTILTSYNKIRASGYKIQQTFHNVKRNSNIFSILEIHGTGPSMGNRRKRGKKVPGS